MLLPKYKHTDFDRDSSTGLWKLRKGHYERYLRRHSNGKFFAAVSLVTGQVISGNSAGNTTIVLPNNPTAGNFVVVVGCCANTATVTVADGAGTPNNYTKSTNSPSTNATAGSRTYIYYLPNVPAGASKTIIVTASAGATSGFAAEFSGVATTTPLERDVAHNAATSQTNINDPTTTTTGDGDLIIGGTSPQNSVTSADSPFTGISAIANGNYGEYLIQSVHGARAVAFTQNTAGQWSAMIAAFTAATVATSIDRWLQQLSTPVREKDEVVSY